MKVKRIIQVFLIIAIVCAMMVPAFADEIYDAKQKQRELEQELRDSEDRLSDLKDKVAKAQQAVDEIDAQIAQVQEIINGYEVQKADLQTKIDELQKQIDEKQVEIEYEYSLMSLRIQFLYENLGDSYVEAFLTSDDFSDALNKVQYLIELSDYDREQMEKLQKLQDKIQDDQDAIKEQKDEIVALIDAQAEQKAVLDEMLAVKAEALGVAMEEEEKAREQNAYIEQMLEEQKDVVNELVKEYNQEHGGSADAGSLIWTSGDFLWPLPSPYYSNWISSWYGWRPDPFGGGFSSFHNGLDLGVPCNTPILSVLDGTVVISGDGWNGGCGNYTVIYHGGNLYTEYMHQNYRVVSVGQRVSQGEVIGYVGTTGSSTGYHLHFGVVASDHGFDYTCRVDPCPYLGLY